MWATADCGGDCVRVKPHHANLGGRNMVFTPLHRELELLAMTPLDQYLLREAIRVGAREQGDLMFRETPHAIAAALARDLCALANRGRRVDFLRHSRPRRGCRKPRALPADRRH